MTRRYPSVVLSILLTAVAGFALQSDSNNVKYHSLSGKVLNTAKEPISNVAVYITIPGKSSTSVKSFTNVNGSYTLANIPTSGPLFVQTLATSDGKYLASELRRALVLDKKANTAPDIIVSARPSDKARYVGTSVCVNCHEAITPEITAKHTASAHMRIVIQGQSQIIDPVGGWGANNDPTGKNTGIMAAPPDGSNGPAVTVTACQKIGVKGFSFGGNTNDACNSGIFIPIAATVGGQGNRYIESGSNTPVPNVGAFKQHFYAKLQDVPATTSRNWSGYPYKGSDREFLLLPVFIAQSGDNSPRFSYYRATRIGNAKNAWVDRGETYSRACAACHVVGMEVKVTNDENMFTTEFGYLEMGVGCESCHGPGSDHVSNPGRAKGIIVPTKLTAKAEREACARCHSLAAPTSASPKGALKYPWNDKYTNAVGNGNFVPGIYDLADFMPGWKTGNGFLSWDGVHGRFHKQQSYELEHSVHANNAIEKVTCTSCHSAHSLYQGPSHAVARDSSGNKYDYQGTKFKNNTICIRCHAGVGPFSNLTKADVAAANAGYGQNTFLNDSKEPLYDPRATDPKVQATINSAMNKLAQEVVKHMNNKAGMGTAIAYTPLDDSRPIGRCITCHMPKTGMMGGYTSVFDPNDKEKRAMIEGDVTSHVGDVIYPYNQYSMYQRSRANASEQSDPNNKMPAFSNVMPSSCSKCHVGARYYMK
jgi:nitrate/TMAO reductase-like tetraheme cytochrome c subunit